MMEKKIALFVLLALVFQTAMAIEFVNHTQKIIGDFEGYKLSGNDFISHKKVPIPESSFTPRSLGYQFVVWNDLFSKSKSNKSYTCDYPVHEAYRKELKIEAAYNRIADDKLSVIVIVVTNATKTNLWKIGVIDLPSCKYIDSERTVDSKTDSVFYKPNSTEVYFKTDLYDEKLYKFPEEPYVILKSKKEKSNIEVFGNRMDMLEVESTESEDKIYLIKQQNTGNESERVSLDNGKGIRILQECIKPNCTYGYVSESLTHDTISLLRRSKIFNNSTIDLKRFDLNGDLRLHMNWTFSPSLDYADVYNLADGEFILVVGKPNVTNSITLHVTKYNVEGQQISKVLEVYGFVKTTLTDIIHGIEIYENEDHLICFLQLQRKGYEVEFFEQCFNGHDMESNAAADMKVSFISLLSMAVLFYYLSHCYY